MLAPEVALLVLAAAAMHATWNALVKVSGDRLLTQTSIVGVGSIVATLLIPFFGAPEPAIWPFIAASVFFHMVYFMALLRAYGVGDLSQVYPIARGTSPLVVGLVAWPVAGEALSGPNLLGVLLVTAGIMALASGRRDGADARAVGWALVTGLLIATFSLFDGLGVRQAEDPMTFIVWVHALEVVPLWLYVQLRRPGQLRPFFSANATRAVIGGVMALGAYGIVLWAYDRSPFAPVAALRETSVVIAAYLGAARLGEPFGVRRIAASIVVVIGVTLLNLPA